VETGNGNLVALWQAVASHRRQAQLAPHLPASPISGRGAQASAQPIPVFTSPCANEPPPTAWKPCAALVSRCADSSAFRQQIFPAWWPHSWGRSGGAGLGVHPKPPPGGGGRRFTGCLRLSAAAAARPPAGNLGRWGQCSFCHRQDGGLSSARGGDPQLNPGFAAALQTLGFLIQSSGSTPPGAGKMRLPGHGVATKVFP